MSKTWSLGPRGARLLLCALSAAAFGCGEPGAISAPVDIPTPREAAPAFSETTARIAEVGGTSIYFSLGDCSGASCSKTAVPLPAAAVAVEFTDDAVRAGSDGKLYRMDFDHWTAVRSNPTYGWSVNSKNAVLTYCHFNGSTCTNYGPQLVTAHWNITEVPALAVAVAGPTSINRGGAWNWTAIASNAEKNETYTYLWEQSLNGSTWTTVSTTGGYSRTFTTGDVSFHLRVTVTSNLGRVFSHSRYVTVGANLDPTIPVTLIGPSNVPPGEMCMWIADVGGGTGPYQYTWTSSHVDFEDWSGDAYLGGAYAEQRMSITVEVTDANGEFGRAQRYINAREDAPSCGG